MSNQSKEIFLVSFLDIAPPFIGGATAPELFLIIKYFVLINIVLGLITGALIGHSIPLILAFFIFFVTFIEVWITSNWLKGHKRGKPPGYFLQSMAKKMTKKGLKKPSFIEHVGRWY
jgi:conjugative transfer region protein (TIGR03750 family)